MTKNITLPNALAKRYIDTCRQCLAKADVMQIFREMHPGKTVVEFGYKTENSLKAAVSKVLSKHKFNKKRLTIELVAQSRAKFSNVDCVDELHKRIQQDLMQHELKLNHIRDVLQELGPTTNPVSGSRQFKLFAQFIERGHSFAYAIAAINPSRHLEKQLKEWFLIQHPTLIGETLKARRVVRKHTYVSLKDGFLLNQFSDSRKADIWTAIGFIFADGSVTERDVQIVVNQGDGDYLQVILKTFLDERIPNNLGPALIVAHSNKHSTSFLGSQPVLRLHLDDTSLALFVRELGMPPNKTTEGLDIGPRIRALDDRSFYCFLCGLFDGDGCLTHGGHQKGDVLHLSFDLHCERICESLKAEIERRSGIPMKVYAHSTNAGKLHYRVSATTTPRALSLLAHMYFHSNFQLRRKVKRADELVNRLRSLAPSYAALDILPSAIAQSTVSREQFESILAVLRAKMTF